MVSAVLKMESRMLEGVDAADTLSDCRQGADSSDKESQQRSALYPRYPVPATCAECCHCQLAHTRCVHRQCTFVVAAGDINTAAASAAASAVAFAGSS
jgi:hypothetical protein